MPARVRQQSSSQHCSAAPKPRGVDIRCAQQKQQLRCLLLQPTDCSPGATVLRTSDVHQPSCMLPCCPHRQNRVASVPQQISRVRHTIVVCPARHALAQTAVQLADGAAPCHCLSWLVNAAAAAASLLHALGMAAGDQTGHIRVWDLTANACSCELVPEVGTAGVRMQHQAAHWVLV
jgi:hypothetical protein